MSCLISGTGRIVNEPQLRNGGGTDVLNFRFAMENGFGDKKQTTFFNVALWGKRAASMTNVLEKGTFLAVHGAELSTREYEKDGQTRTSLELRLDKFDLGPRSSNGNGGQTSGSAAHDDDEIPF
ncbi:single-stranded DNA-binding protein [Roseinatronobacter sp.]|uniref:single-stranded DNA-binding protein n=1 Tax=Roseinatronobacter sp. TaxID=1945755 RepID=UPI0025CC4FD4|nr:single-stranded DNA-binding protein [Roseibaca sp.]